MSSGLPETLQGLLEDKNRRLAQAGEPPVEVPPDEDARAHVRSLRRAIRDASAQLSDVTGEVEDDADPADDRVNELERELAFERSRLPDTKGAAQFRQHYEGPLETDAITEAWESMGYPVAPDTPTEELMAHEQIAAASAGASSSVGRLKVGTEEYAQRVAAAQTSEELYRVMDEAGSPRYKGD